MVSVEPETPKACSSFEAPRVEMPKASTGWGMGTGYPSPRPTKGFVGSSVVSSPPAGSVAGPGEKKTILLLSRRARTPPVATFVEN